MTCCVIQRYTLEDFESIIDEGFEVLLPSSTLDLISVLAEEVGAPSYVKTPVFEKRNDKKRSKFLPVADDEWNAIRNFKTIQLEEKTGVYKNIDDIRNILNKLTDDTYENSLNDLYVPIDGIIDDSENYDKVVNIIFDIASSNSFFSKIYAKLYYNLIDKYPIFKEKITMKFKNFIEDIDKIEFCDPDEDYNKFCDNNKLNEQRRALSLFYVNVMKYDVIQVEDVIELMEKIQALIYKYIYEENKTSIIEEITEILYIIITNSVEELKDSPAFPNLFTKITTVTNLSSSSCSSLSNKIIFKHMDILELFE